MQQVDAYYINKSKWPRGPWQDESDASMWMDEKTNLLCLVSRHPEGGFLRGYVGVDIGHELHGKDEDEINSDQRFSIDTIDFSGHPMDMDWLISKIDNPRHIWWFGFSYRMGLNPFQSVDSDGYGDIWYMRRECKRIALALSVYRR